MKTPISIGMPKMIFGILATIAIPVVAWFLLSPLWFWLGWEVLAAVLVAIGCAGEWFMIRHQAKPGGEAAHIKIELQFILAVAVGVAMECFSLVHVIPESLRQERKIAELETANLQLHERIQPRRISEQQKKDFIKALEGVRKRPVLVFTGLRDPETAVFAEHIRELLNAAGCGMVKEFEEFEIITRPGLVSFDRISESHSNHFVSLLFYGEMGKPLEVEGLRILTEKGNNKHLFGYSTNGPIPFPLALNLAFKRISIPVGTIVSTNWPFVFERGE